jgi:hypothetical protein
MRDPSGFDLETHFGGDSVGDEKWPLQNLIALAQLVL